MGLQPQRSLVSPERTRFEIFQATESHDRMARPSVFAADGAPVTQTLEFPTDSEFVQFPHTRFAMQRYRFDLHMPYNRHHLAQPRQDVPIDDLAMVDLEMKLEVGAPVPSLRSAAKMKSLRKYPGCRAG